MYLCVIKVVRLVKILGDAMKVHRADDELIKMLRQAARNEDGMKALFEDIIIRYVEKQPCLNSLLAAVFYEPNLEDEAIIELLNVLLMKQSNNLYQEVNGDQVIKMATRGKRKMVVELLLSKFNYTINQTFEYGNSLAHIFIRAEKCFFFKVLTADGSLLTKTDDEILQIELKSQIFLVWLLEKGLDYSMKNTDGKTILQLCIDYNLQHLSSLLLQFTSNVPQQLNLNNPSVLLLVFQNNEDKRKLYKNNAFKAIRYSNYAMRYTEQCVESLIVMGADPLCVDVGTTPLFWAIKMKEKHTIIDMFLETILAENKNISLALLELCKSCTWWDLKSEYYVHSMSTMMTHGGDVNYKDDDEKSLLYWAFVGKNLDLVTYLMQYNVDFGVTTKDQENLYHALCTNLDVGIQFAPRTLSKLFDILICKKSCDVNCSRTMYSQTPLHYAAVNESCFLANKLIEHGAIVNCRDSIGCTPLHMSVLNKSLDVTHLLLQNDANVNERDNYSRTPLYIASSYQNNIFMVPLLLKAGALVNVFVDMHGKTPLYQAVFGDCTNNVRELISYGADLNNRRVISVICSLSNDMCKSLKWLLLLHWAKFHAAHLYIPDEYHEILSESVISLKFRLKCQKEVELMKRTNLLKEKSIHDILRMTIFKRSYLLDEPSAAVIVKSKKLAISFPRYHPVILSTYRETKVWKLISHSAIDAWNRKTNYRLPPECLFNILSYLQSADLISLNLCLQQ